MSAHPFCPAPAYRHELALLQREGWDSWQAVAALDAQAIRTLCRSSPGSEARLIRLRGQARLVVAIDLAPGDAALLLHAGVADPRGLAAADAHTLHRQIGRLQRRLSATGLPPISLTTVRGWVVQAAVAAGRSWN
ncbi:MAG: DUF4332 domain-containing protein [Cyanobium sp.]